MFWARPTFWMRAERRRLSSGWFSPRPRKSTARRGTCRSTRSILLCGQSPYAATKIAADALGESYHRSFGLPVTILRPFNTFGPRQSARAIIPTIISQALVRPVVKLGRTDPRRDLTYVKDTAQGFVSIAACDAAAGTGRQYRPGRGHLDRRTRRAYRPPARPSNRRRIRDRSPPPAGQRGREAACRHRAGSVALGLEASVHP